MPIYEYRRPDGTTFEIQQTFAEDALKVDPETGVPVERVLHPPAVHFKGKGFYNTDYGTRKRQRETAAAAEGSSSGDSSSKDSSTKGSSSGDGSSSSSSSSAGGDSSSGSSSSGSNSGGESKGEKASSSGSAKSGSSGKDAKSTSTKKS
jgi:predicted nucleic acid-binding Zn ribbon protein